MRIFATAMFTTILLNWFAAHGRTLPWRGSKDPYAIWLSEVILQQTRIAQGTDYYLRFMAKWPTVEQLAAASEDEVLRLWQGLGYYSRARNLHAAARAIAARGAFPNTYEEIRKLKGVGDYTAAAIASMAFGLPYAAVDGNVYRVLARYYGIDTAINSSQGKKLFQSLANSLCPQQAAGTWNQALMDFGALQCTAAAPHCIDCPLQETCTAFREGRVTQLPVKERKLKIRERYFTYYYIRCKGKIAIHQRGAGDIWQGLWEPALIEVDSLPPGSVTVKHVLTHQILFATLTVMDFDAAELTQEQPAKLLQTPTLPHDFIWIAEHELEKYALPALVVRLLKQIHDT